MAAPTQPLFSFGLFADAQYANKPNDLVKKKFYNEANDKIAKVISEFNKQDLAFCLQLGDIIDGNEAPELVIQDLEAVLESISPLKHRLHHILGNHCLAYPGGKKTLMPKLGMADRYYVAEDYEGFAFIALDGTDITVKEGGPSDASYIQAQEWLAAHPREQYPHAWPWNAAIGQTQLQWLEDTLKRLRDRHQKAVLFCHYALFPEAASEEHLLWNHLEVRELLARYSDVVVVYFAGHYHHGGYYHDPATGIHHLTLRAILEASPDKGEDCENSFALVDVFHDKLTLQGFGWARAQSRDMAFTQMAERLPESAAVPD